MTKERFIDPAKVFGPEFLKIEKPARYLGGEVGSRPPVGDGDRRFRFALCFPDLYEIGMSNNAIRILYNGLSAFGDEMVVERVFAPAPDYEALLRSRDVPLHTLESGIPLCGCDMIGFSIGYELLATNILTVLECGRIPVLAEERGEGDPIVIAGGPAVTNPHPFADFLDAVYIGEAEAVFYDLARKLAKMKEGGASRSRMMETLRSCPEMWFPGRKGSPGKGARRAVFTGFPSSAASTVYPVPVLPTVQGHGTVEIMRGCPNGCRFCHAGFFYRPQRAKSLNVIMGEVESLVRNGGYREITLASLSSGDFPDITGLFRILNKRWKSEHVSFQLPSLKVNSFTLPLLSEISEVRKSGLTFAVETPVESWQAAINKTVDFGKIIEILEEARELGFRSAKFYFMIGLPVPERGRGEGIAIVDFLKKICAAARMPLSVNIGTFVPKPHTPFQYASQIGEEEALDTIFYIKDALRSLRTVSVSYHHPFTSMLEGIISRGDERVGRLLLRAYSKGARLDAWDEHFKGDVWRQTLREAPGELGFDPVEGFLSGRDTAQPLPWDDINLFVSNNYYKNEFERSAGFALTPKCSDPCAHPCGSCNSSFKIVLNSIHNEAEIAELEALPSREPKGKAFFRQLAPSESVLDDTRLVVSFAKKGKAALYPMHSVSEAFSRAFYVLGLPVRFTEGFNPLPRMEFSQPLALGMESEDDLFAVWLAAGMELTDRGSLVNEFNAALPVGLEVREMRIGSKRSEGKRSIGSLYGGSSYRIREKESGILKKLIPVLQGAGFGVMPTEEAGSVLVSAQDFAGSGLNMMKVLREALPDGEVFGYVDIVRERCLAKSSDGRETRLYDAL